MTMPGISLEEMCGEVEREIKMRERVYPTWVRNKRLTEQRAFRQISVMRVVLATLQGLADKDPDT